MDNDGRAARPPERSASAYLPAFGMAGRDDPRGSNETSSRPPVDLGGALRYAPASAKRRYMRSYDAGQRQPEISPKPGARGKYG